MTGKSRLFTRDPSESWDRLKLKLDEGTRSLAAAAGNVYVNKNRTTQYSGAHAGASPGGALT